MKQRALIFLIISVFFALLIESCDKNEYNPELKNTFLKELAAEKGITIGSLFNYAYANSTYKEYKIYQEVMSKEFNLYALEWEFAPDELWTDEYEYNFTYLDKALLFAEQNNMKVRGTHLLWYAQTPEWLENGDYTTQEVTAMLKAYISALFSHVQTEFPDILTEISVANEILSDDEASGEYGYLRDCYWVRKLGEYYIDSAFVWVNNVYPDAKLILNEYGNEFKGDFKTQRFFELATRLLTNNIPIDAVGMQCHFTIDENELVDVPFDQAKLSNAIADFQNLGLEVLITELDVRINDDEKGKTETKLNKQAELYRQVFETCLQYTVVKNITFWGFNDDLSYLNESAEWLPQKRDWGLIFDADFNPKPAYFSISDVLE